MRLQRSRRADGEHVADWQDRWCNGLNSVREVHHVCGGELIRERFRLGGIVVEALERSQHGDAVVVKMAERMSAAVGVSSTCMQ